MFKTHQRKAQMNRIYKSIYNAARRCVVCVSEIQSSRVKSKSERKETPVKPILSMLSAAVLVAMSSHAMAAPEPANLIQVGGIYYQYDADGKCTVYEPYETSKAINWNYTFSDDPEQTILDMRPTDHTLYNSLADGGTGSLTIKSGMTVTITGGTKTNAYAFENLATNAGSAAIINEGTLTIQGGTGSSAHGIYINADGRGSVGTISNTGTGSLTIKASQESSGIYQIANGGYDFNTSLDSYGKGKVENLVNGVMNIIGNESHSAIESLSGYTSAYASILPNYMKPTMAVAAIENSGVMNLNKYAIGEFNHIKLCVGSGCHSGGGAVVGRVSQKLEITGGGSFLNKSTGTVNAEAGAIFESTGQSEITVNTPIPITIYTPNEGTKVTELDSYGTSETTVTTGWKLKDDWYNYSTWEDGGKLVITDVVAGSAEAQTIIDSFQDRFGTGTAIEFTGTEVNTVSLTREGEAEKPAFTFEHVYELIDNGEVKNGSVIISEVISGTVLSSQETLNSVANTEPDEPDEPGDPDLEDPPINEPGGSTS